MTASIVTGPPWPDGPSIIDLDALVRHGVVTLADLARLEMHTAPSIGIARGACTGAALATAMAVDFLVAGPQATFGDPGSWVDIVVRRGVGIIGRKAVAYLAMSGRSIDADLAHLWGLVTNVSPEPTEEAASLLGRLSERSGLAVATILTQAHRGSRADYTLSALSSPLDVERSTVSLTHLSRER